MKTILNIEGMTCSACSNGLEKYLNKQNGIKEATVNLVMATASIEYDDNISIEDLNRFVAEAGFKSLGEKSKNDKKANSLKVIIAFGILAIILMFISMGDMVNSNLREIKMQNPIAYTITVLTITTIFLIWGFDIIKNGIKNIIHKMPNMDSLVGIGVIINYAYSLYNSVLILSGQTKLIHSLYFEASAMIILFVKLGRYIDKKNKIKAVDSIKNLVTLTPKNGVILRNNIETIVTINEIQKGDIVICKPGEKIAVDGTILEGKTHTDESFLTGESKPVSKTIGSSVMAGSINYDGYIKYEAEKIGKDSSISHIVDLVVEATNTKAPISRLADRISGYFVPAIFLIAIISFALNMIITKEISQAILAMVSVLVVACPCALGLATPLAMVVAIGNCSKNGILVKSSEILETVNRIDTVVFDKTGTITSGELSIVDGKYTEEELKLLQSLESKSNHPLAKSICKNKSEIYEVENFEEIPGMGIYGKINDQTYFAGNNKFLKELNINNKFEKLEKEYAGNGYSIVYLFNNTDVLSILALSDKVKPEIIDVIKELKDSNKKVIMLTGDNSLTAAKIASDVGIEEIYSNTNPEEKLKKIEELNKNKNCLMVGDGINDSPALRKATIGVSVANGTDISADSANVILLKDDMNKICYLFKIGKYTIKIIKQNLFWALFYNACMIPLATGLLPIHLNPMIASLAMTLSSLTVVLNSLRLRKNF
ncbi:MAG: cation-translocating P-type ATPase [Clostridia bacterium]|nr:cation-translocating P-type ATPase [Clostridia bacterium]